MLYNRYLCLWDSPDADVICMQGDFVYFLLKRLTYTRRTLRYLMYSRYTYLGRSKTEMRKIVIQWLVFYCVIKSGFCFFAFRLNFFVQIRNFEFRKNENWRSKSKNSRFLKTQNFRTKVSARIVSSKKVFSNNFWWNLCLNRTCKPTFVICCEEPKSFEAIDSGKILVLKRVC